MSTAIEAENAQVSTNDISAVSRVRNNFLACRIKFKWFGTSKSLTSDQKSRAAESFGAEGAAISAVGHVGFGILLFTGTTDAEGTLGGLIQSGRRIHEHVQNALRMGELCSNDPVCAQHESTNPHERRFLHGAACHGCLLIAETSCEQHNEFLDRSLVVPTVANRGVEFFPADS